MTTLQDLAHQTDTAAFQLLYHDPRIHTATIAAEFGIKISRVSEFAHLLGVQTRRELGLQYKPTLLARRVRQPKKLGPCNPRCPMWRHCKAGRLWLDTLPCEEVLEWEEGIEYERDSLRTLWVMPMVVRVAVEAMG